MQNRAHYKLAKCRRRKKKEISWMIKCSEKAVKTQGFTLGCWLWRAQCDTSGLLCGPSGNRGAENQWWEILSLLLFLCFSLSPTSVFLSSVLVSIVTYFHEHEYGNCPRFIHRNVSFPQTVVDGYNTAPIQTLLFKNALTKFSKYCVPCYHKHFSYTARIPIATCTQHRRHHQCP